MVQENVSSVYQIQISLDDSHSGVDDLQAQQVGAG